MHHHQEWHQWHRPVWPKAPAEGPRRPAEAFPWGAAEGPEGQLFSLASLWGGPAVEKTPPQMGYCSVESNAVAYELGSPVLLYGHGQRMRAFGTACFASKNKAN